MTQFNADPLRILKCYIFLSTYTNTYLDTLNYNTFERRHY